MASLLPATNTLLAQLAGLAPVMRRSLDNKTLLPTTPKSLFSTVSHLIGQGQKFTAQGILVATNLVPAMVPRADYLFESTYRNVSGAGYLLGPMVTDFVRDQRTLLWDTQGGTATVEALVKVLLGDIVTSSYLVTALPGGASPMAPGANKKPPPSWLVSALEALNAGESWILARNKGLLDVAQEAVAVWLPESAWFGHTPTTSQRNRAAIAITELRAKTLQGQAQGALSLDAYLNAATAAGVPQIPPPGAGRPLWQKAVVAAGAVGAVWYGVRWWKGRPR